MTESVEEFLSRGGKIQEVEPGVRGEELRNSYNKPAVDPLIKDCKCGCLGDWTEHTMRAGESGRDPNVVILNHF